MLCNIFYPKLDRRWSVKKLVLGTSMYTDLIRSKEYFGTTLEFFWLQMRFEPSPTAQVGFPPKWDLLVAIEFDLVVTSLLYYLVGRINF